MITAGEGLAGRSNLVQAARLTTEDALNAEVEDLGKRQDLVPFFQGFRQTTRLGPILSLFFQTCPIQPFPIQV
jgi:hypothetical protein